MDTRLARWERRTEWPLLVAALVFLGTYAWPILRPDLDEAWRRTCSAVSWIVWAAYAADYLIRLIIAERRWDFVRQNLIDLAAVALPMLRPLRLLRALLVLDVIQERMSTRLRGRVVSRVAILVAFLSSIAALAMLDAERANPDANIRSYGDALWWAGTTITTVGYGDRYPTTGEGRLVGFGLMLGASPSSASSPPRSRHGSSRKPPTSRPLRNARRRHSTRSSLSCADSRLSWTTG